MLSSPLPVSLGNQTSQPAPALPLMSSTAFRLPGTITTADAASESTTASNPLHAGAINGGVIMPSTTAGISHASPPKTRNIWLVTGPAGCGKSTIALHLSKSLGWPYIEGDDHHTAASREKMSNGIPLTDEDRWDWLGKLRDLSVATLSEGHDGVVLTCSALKRKYRDVIRVAQYFHPEVRLHFIYLAASEEVLVQRVAARKGHYMGAAMVHSQFQALEPPTPDEVDVLTVDVTRSVEEVESEALEKVKQVLDSA